MSEWRPSRAIVRWPSGTKPWEKQSIHVDPGGKVSVDFGYPAES